MSSNDCAGVTSKKVLNLAREKLDKRLEGETQVEASRHLRSQADEAIYHHKLGGEQRNDGLEVSKLSEMNPEAFESAAGMDSGSITRTRTKPMHANLQADYQISLDGTPTPSAISRMHA